MTNKKRGIRILIADDHTILREGLNTMLSDESDFSIVGEASNCDEALDLASRVEPDILLLDFFLPNNSGIEVLKSLKELGSQVRTILLSGDADGDSLSKAFELGAWGLVLKDSSTGMLFQSIRAVMAGKYWIGRESFPDMEQALKRSRHSASKSPSKKYRLTPREMEVIKAVASGFSNKEIATQFSISEQTVKHHITNIFDKLGVYNRLELTLFVFHHGIIEA